MSGLTALRDDEFLDELQECLGLEDFEDFLNPDIVGRTRSALIDLKNRTIALAHLAETDDIATRSTAFARLVDSRLVRANRVLREANRAQFTDANSSKYLILAERPGAELRMSDRAFALDLLEREEGFTANEWLAARAAKRLSKTSAGEAT